MQRYYRQEGSRVRKLTQVFVLGVIAALAALGALGVGTVGFAASSSAGATPGSGAPTGSRPNDGEDLLPQSRITEQDAIHAAQTAASGDLNEVDLEHLGSQLVWNVDVGNNDVRVDADTGTVVRVDD